MRLLLREIESFLNNIVDSSSSQRYNILSHYISSDYLGLINAFLLDRS